MDATGLRNLLSLDALEAPGDLRRLSLRREVLFDITLLDAALNQRAAAARLALTPALTRSVLGFAMALNSTHMERVASQHLLMAWSQLVCLAVTRHPAALKLALPAAAPARLADLCFSAASMLPRADDGLAAELLAAVTMLLTVLRAEVESCYAAPDADWVLDRVLPPYACQELLRNLLASLLSIGREVATRHQVYGALLAYLHLCRPPPWAQASPVSEALLAALPAEAAQHSTGRLELDAGNLRELQRQAGLLHMLAREGTPQALSLVQAILGLARGSNAALVDEVFRSRLPETAAVLLERTPRSAILAPLASRTLDAAAAQLSLLLSVAHPAVASGAVHLVQIGLLSQLAGFQLVDALLSQRSDMRAVLRERIFLPTLRLVSALLESDALQGSLEVSRQALAFVDAHAEVLLRVLGVQLEEADAGHLQEAQAAARLLCCLGLSGGSPPRMAAGVERLCADALRPDLRVAAARMPQIWLLQSTLAAFLCAQCTTGRVVLPAAGGAAALPSVPQIAKLANVASDALRKCMRGRHELRYRLEEQLKLRGAVDKTALGLVDAETDVRVLHALLQALLATVLASWPATYAGNTADARLALGDSLKPVLMDVDQLKGSELGGNLPWEALFSLCRRARELCF